MSSKKVFFISFLICLSVVMSAYALLYFLVSWDSTEINQTQYGIPLVKDSVNNSKTCLIVVNEAEQNYYFLLKLNGIQNKVSLLSINQHFVMPQQNITLNQSLEKAGILQVSEDITECFDIKVDYYLQTDFHFLFKIISNFKSVDIFESFPQPIKDLLINNITTLDINTINNIITKAKSFFNTDEGIIFLNEIFYALLKNNFTYIDDDFWNSFRENYSYITTNINNIEIDTIKTITSILISKDCEFLNDAILVNDNEYTEKITVLFKE